MRPARAAAVFALALVLGLPPNCAAEPRPLRQIPQGRKINIAALGLVLIPTNFPKIPAAQKTPAAATAAKMPSRALLAQAGAAGQELLRDAQGDLAPEESRRRAAHSFDLGDAKTMTLESPSSVVSGRTGAAAQSWPLRPAVKKSRPLRPAPGKLSQWTSRYAPSEVVSTLTSIGALYASQALGFSPMASAFISAMGENLGYYGTILSRDLRDDAAKARRAKRKFHPLKTLRNIAIEFGLPEVLDSGFMRPFCMWLMLQHFPGFMGVLGGKLIADAAFYLPTIALYEFRKKQSRRGRRTAS